MSHAAYLEEMLRPLGVYNPEGVLQGAELLALGLALDSAMAELEEQERESCLVTAREWGIERLAELLPWAHQDKAEAERKAALTALLRIGEDGFTPQAVNQTLAGCGINAVALETETPGWVKVVFPNVAGIPEGFAEISVIIEAILPAHLGVEYCFWYLVWRQLEELVDSWAELESMDLSWEELEVLMAA